MGRYFAYANGIESIQHLPAMLLHEGDKTSPRGKTTYELRDVMIEVHNPADVTMKGIGREWSSKIAVAEFLQLVGGFSEPETMKRIAPFFNTVTNGGVFHGAYGPRISMQMPKVIDRLKRDGETRQAISVIWDPLHDLMQEDRLDLPCTIDMNFAMRKGKLLMSTHMRSNDVWKGWCYDLFQFSQMQWTVANILGVPAGPYTHFTNSLHLYDTDIDVARDIRLNRVEQQQLYGIDASTWTDATQHALAIWYSQLKSPSETERWMERVVDSWNA